jgi:hypothetical protein
MGMGVPGDQPTDANPTQTTTEMDRDTTTY